MRTIVLDGFHLLCINDLCHSHSSLSTTYRRVNRLNFIASSNIVISLPEYLCLKISKDSERERGFFEYLCGGWLPPLSPPFPPPLVAQKKTRKKMAQMSERIWRVLIIYDKGKWYVRRKRKRSSLRIAFDHCFN